ncbi:MULTISPECIES: hypothetical protein [Arthrobacter]|uniref:Uncharacterized protein n=1 Tax=Arthrobacter terricola TaxID=2547396 RepID=A0A4R5KF38_9MICC|nr:MULTISPECIES: hypothetical protein [Arthrobacter]MBT8162577.1 hypothetical protein [Arthrobacter sp. GN70]TDF92867.1 hypothetical protein E1809_17045 [Arthrobacter terricola]
MNQAVWFVIVAATLAVIALLCVVIARRTILGVKSVNCKSVFASEHERAKQMFSDTVEYRSGLAPEMALKAIDAELSAVAGSDALHGDVRLVERTPNCLRYSMSNRLVTFLEAAVAASPRGAGSTVTLDVVRWLEHGGTPVARENLEWMRKDIELALRSADPALEVVICHED